jgi:hypothetical protein
MPTAGRTTRAAHARRNGRARWAGAIACAALCASVQARANQDQPPGPLTLSQQAALAQTAPPAPSAMDLLAAHAGVPDEPLGAPLRREPVVPFTDMGALDDPESGNLAISALGWGGWLRRGGVVDLGPDLHLIGERSDLVLDTNRGRATPAQLLDLSAELDTIQLGDLALTVAAGLRVATTGSTLDDEPGRMDVLAVFGPGFTWKQGPIGQLRASALGDASGVNDDYFELRVEQMLMLSPASSVALGYQQQRNLFGTSVIRGTDREAVLLEFRFTF